MNTYFLIQGALGLVIGGLDLYVLYKACDTLRSPGDSLYTRTPGTRVMQIPLAPVIVLLCPNGGVLYYKVTKEQLVVFCNDSGGA